VLGTPSRRVLNVYDGIVGRRTRRTDGTDDRPIGSLAPARTRGLDVVLAWIMGFEWRRIPVLVHAIGELAGGVRITDFDGTRNSLKLRWNRREGVRDLRLSDVDLDLAFEPHHGWKATSNALDRARTWA